MIVNASTQENARAGSVDPTREMPVYLQIQRYFLDRIGSGELRHGDRLPPEKEIAKDFGTSRATVQNAMTRLVHEGWIEKQVGRGTFVSNSRRSAIIDLDDVRSFEQDADSHGDSVQYRLLKVGRESADELVSSRLGVETGTTIFSFERLRLVSGEIIGLERRFFAPGITLDFSVEALDMRSTHSLVRDHLGQSIGRMDAAIRAVVADGETARKLEIEPGAPLLLRRHTMFSTAAEVILFGEAYYCEPFAFRYSAGFQQKS